ncbi:phage tail family protein [Bacillus sp. OTU530]|uniref:phage tail family protein n=1 Tax=Bacillus sp. OTU530 TaxID=3043862 RepID=UPI00313C4324
MNTTVVRLDGTTYDLAQLGIMTRDFNPSSPSYEHVTEKIEGQHGEISTMTTIGTRTISCSFYLKAVNSEDYALFRDEVFAIFHSEEAFYLIDSRNPGKRWKVKGNSSFSVEQTYKHGFFDVEFVAFMPFAESVGTTQDDFTFDSELWQIGQGLLVDEESQKYTFDSSSFRVYNAGNVTVNPRELPLTITFTGTSSTLKIKNTTTNEEWQYTGTTVSGDTVKLDGVKSLKNNGSIFKDTNYQLITLKPGWNNFEITGASGAFSISFLFRYYYL